MPQFTYIAHDINGNQKTGILSAPDSTIATEQLRSRGLFPKEVTLQAEIPSAPRLSGKNRLGLDMEIRMPAALSVVNRKQLMVFTRQLATLIHAGLPLLRALQVLERQQTSTALRKTTGAISAAIEEGSTFADALAAHPRIFNRLYINMVKAGEAGGVLDVVLERLASYMEKAQRVKNRIRSAMTYPIVVLVASTAIMMFLMLGIIPRFESIFADMLEGRSLPPLTLFVMGISENIKQGWPTMAGAILLIWIATAIARRFRSGRLFTDRIRLALPLFGRLSRLASLARFSRTLGTLMQSGVPVLQGLDIVRQTLSNEILSDAVQTIHDRIKSGDSMAAPIEELRVFPPVFGGMVEVGEETGELPAMLIKIADMYEDEVDSTVSSLSSIIEPALIVLLAGVVGTIVVAMFLPMVSIIGNLS